MIQIRGRKKIRVDVMAIVRIVLRIMDIVMGDGIMVMIIQKVAREVEIEAVEV